MLGLSETIQLFFSQSLSSVDPSLFDLAVLSRCDASLFLYGSFGFFASFLADAKDVFLPLQYR